METPPSDSPHQRAAEQVAHAHHLLRDLRERLDEQHPELEEALEKLESALNILTLRTGGML
jgi:prefoldin subunit 5